MKVESLADITRQYIEKMIVTNEFKPGQQIKEDDIAERLGISRPPIREAFKTLEEQGLIIRKPRRGAFVAEMTETDILEVYTLKAELYAMATSLAMDKFSEEQRIVLQGLVNQMIQIVNSGSCDILNYQKIHHKFHLMIMEVAGNQRLMNFASNLHKQIRRFSYQTLHYKEHLDASSAFHKKIVQKIMAHDKNSACELMKAHVIDGMNFLLNLPDLFEPDAHHDNQRNNLSKNAMTTIDHSM